jgi:hypothetical protein
VHNIRGGSGDEYPGTMYKASEEFILLSQRRKRRKYDADEHMVAKSKSFL